MPEKYPRPVIDRVMIVVAAGSGARFGEDKMMLPVAGLPLVAHTVAAVSTGVDRCILVCRTDQTEELSELNLGADLVPGGPSRTESEMAGLSAIGEPAGLIGIHDGARPLVSPTLVEQLFETAARIGGAVPVIDPGLLIRKSDLTVLEGVFVAQTPQVFRGEALLTAYEAAAAAGYVGADTAEVVRRFGTLDIGAVAGDPANIKVTDRRDMETVRPALEASRSGPR
jgi:2-C-methyl-D-erythritol 4-phosphate cytidylyltransferase